MLTLGGRGVQAQQTINYTTGQTGTGAIIITGGLNATTLSITSGAATQSGTISESGTVGVIIKTGSGTLTLSGTNTYSGGTMLNAGTLAVSANNNLGATAGALTFNGGILETTASFSSARAVTLTGTGTFQTDTGTFTLSSVISGSGALTKTGTGTMLLTGTSTYTGVTTISKGTLAFSGGTAALNPSSGSPGDLYIGRNNGDNGTLLISGGAKVNNGNSYISYNFGNTGSATVTGTGSIWTTNVDVGDSSGTSGTLTISNGGKVSSGSSSLNLGTVTIDGVGSTWSGIILYFGGTTSGSSTITVSNGGTVSTSLSYLGFGGVLNGTVTGTGSTWSSSTALQLADINAATLTISNNALVTSPTVKFAASGNAVATINLQSGGVLASSQLLLGQASSALNFNGGTLRALGTNSNFMSGFAATNAVLQSGGGTIDTNGFNIGITALSGTGGITKIGAGTLTLNGTSSYTGATIINTGTLALGSAGGIASSSGVVLSGTATFDVTAGNQTIQDLSGVSGTVSLGSRTLTVGTANSTTFGGIFNVTSGALFKTGTGTLTVTGTSALSAVNINNINQGTLQIISGGALEDAQSVIGNVLGQNGTVVVDGAGSRWVTTAFVDVGGSGGGTLIVTNGGTVISSSSVIGAGGVASSATVDGNGSLWKITTSLSVTAGSLTISNSGSVTSSTVTLGGTTTSGTLNLNGGTLSTGQVALNLGAGNVNFDGGTLKLTGTQSNLFSGLGVTLNAGGGTINTGTFTVTTGAQITGTGSLTKIGSSTLTLTGSNSYSGGTTISAGTLQLGDGTGSGTLGTGAVANNGALVLNEGSDVTLVNNISGSGGLTKTGTSTVTLTGTSTYSGNTTVKSGVLVVDGASAITATSTFTVGDLSGDNGAFTIQNGGQVASGDAYIGNAAGSTGTVTVTGTGSAWNLTSPTARLNVGENGSGTLVISNGATVSSFAPYIGDFGSGTLTLSNGGSLIVTAHSNFLVMGNHSGSVSTLNFGDYDLAHATTSGTLQASRIFAGNAVGATGVINFNQTDSLTLTAEILEHLGIGRVVQRGTGTTILTNNFNAYSGGTTINGGILEVASENNIGNSLGTAGGLTFGGGELLVTSTSTFTEGVTLNAGANKLAAINGSTSTFSGTITGSGSLTIGDGTNTGKVLLTGSNSFTGNTLLVSGTIVIGNNSALGTGALVSIDPTVLYMNGINMANPIIMMADTDLEVDGTDSATQTGTISESGTIAGINKIGTGKLTLNGTNTYTGTTTITTGTLALGSLGSIATSSGVLLSGTATFDISAANQTIQDLAGLSGTVSLGSKNLTAGSANSTTFGGNITGGGSLAKAGTGTLTLTGTNSIGGTTNVNGGTLKIASGGKLSGNTGQINNGATAVVDGAGSTWTNNSLNISGTVLITNGATVSSTSGAGIGYNSVGSMVVDGAGSSWTTDLTNGMLSIAGNATGTLTISNGGSVSDWLADIGQNGITGTALVSGGTWTSTAGINLGVGATGIITQTGGLITAPVIDLGPLLGGNGILNLNGGVLAAGQVMRHSASGNLGTVNFDGGTLQLTGNQGNLFANNPTVTLNAGGGTIDTGTFTVATATSLTGTGSLTKTGTGTLKLTGTNTYSGGTTLASGTLVIGNNSALGTGLVTVGDGASIGLTSTFTSSFQPKLSNDFSLSGTIGIVSIGVGGGSITINGTTTVAGSTTLGTVNRAKLIFQDIVPAAPGANLTLLCDQSAVTQGFQILGSDQLDVTTVGANGKLFLANTNQDNTTILHQLVIQNGAHVYDNDENQLGLTATVTIQSGGTYTAGFLTSETINTLLGAGTLTTAGVNTVTVTVNQGNFSGQITEVPSPGPPVFPVTALVKATAGTLILSGTNTYSGGTAINGGTLSVSADNNLGSSTGTLTFNGGTLETTAGYSSARPVALTGVGTFQTDTGTLTLTTGITGTGDLVKTGAGTLLLTGTSTYNGVTTVNFGTLAISATGGAITVSSTITVGSNNADSGNMTISNGGQVADARGYIGYNSGSTGSVTVIGTGSKWGNGTLYVGYSGTAALSVSNGATVTGPGFIGLNSGSTGSVTVTGAGSKWDSQIALDVGDSGNGILTISNGGLVSDGSGFIAGNVGGTGTVTVTGTGSSWQNSSILNVGNQGTGTLTISNSGSVSASTVSMSLSGTAGGTINLDSDGVLMTGQVINRGGSGGTALNFNGGILRATGTSTDFISNFTGTEVSLLSGGGTIDNGGFGITINSPFSGTGGATFAGTGKTILTGTNTYSGGTTISSGTLQLGNGTLNGSFGSGAVVDNGALVFAEGSAITFANTISGNGTVTQNGPGTVTLTGSNSYSGGTIFAFGTLILGNSSALGTGALTVLDPTVGYANGVNIANPIIMETDTTLEVDNADAATQTGTISETGTIAGIIKTGTGTLSLKGTNTYTGNTTVNGGLLVVDTGVINSPGANLVVGAVSADNGALDISNGGSVSENRAYIGRDFGSTGEMTVTGTGSRFSVGQFLYVGYSGTGTMTVSNGGSVSASAAYFIGYGSGSMGSVTVSGTGSTLTGTSTNIFVGLTGSGTLDISNGGSVSNHGYGYIGYDPGSVGSVTVTGTGSTWSNSQLKVGVSGTADLAISNSGSVSTGVGYIGENSGSTGNVTVTGTNSTWSNTVALYVGELGTGTLTISNGGTVSAGTSDIGFLSGGTGSVTVTDTNSVFSTTNGLIVGDEGTGTLTISNGGLASSMVTTLSATGGATGTINLNSGGVLATGQVVRGSGTGGAALNFNGGILRATGTSTDFISNFTGTQVSLLSGGGTIDNNGYSIGIKASLTGTGGMTYTGTGTTTLTGTSNYAGLSVIEKGTLSVSGTTATLGQIGSGVFTILYVGYNPGDSGTLTVSNGAHVTEIELDLGLNATAHGSATVTGPGSVLYTQNLLLGDQGSADFTVSNGAQLTSAVARIGESGTGTSTMTVTGTGTSWMLNGTIGVGANDSSSGVLTLSNNATANAGPFNVILAANDSSRGTVNLLSGATLKTGQISVGSGTGGGQLNFNGGILQAWDAETDFISNFTGTQVSLKSGGGTIDNNGYNITINAPFTGTGGATFTGAATTVLAGNSTYSGATTISQGALLVNGSTLSTAPVTVATGATLGGTGSTGNVTVTSGANLNLQDGLIGTLTVGGLTSGGGTASAFYFDINTTGSVTTLDSITDTGTLTLIGAGGTTITIGALGGTTSASAGTYTLLTYTGTQVSLADLNLTTTIMGSMTLSLVQSGDIISLLIAPTTTSTTYVYGATVQESRVISGGTTQVTTTITNTGTGTADSLDGNGLTATGSGTVSGGLPISVGPVGNDGGTASGTGTYAVGTTTGTQTVSGTATSVTNSTISGSATLEGTTTATVDVVANRVVTATSVDLGRVVLNVGINGTSTLSTTGDDLNFTRVTVGNGGPDVNGISATGNTSTVFNGAGVTSTRTLSGKFSTAGSTSGTFTLVTTGEGLTGEAPINVALSYTADAVNKRVITDGPTTNLGVLHNGATVSGTTTAFTTTGTHDTTTDVSVAAGSGIADANGILLDGPGTTFDGIISSGTRTLSGTIVNATGGTTSGTFGLAVTTLENGGAGLRGEGAYNNVNVAYSAFVYTGQGVWNTNGGGSWGAVSATPANWTANGGTPGLDGNFTTTDSATFGAALTSGVATVALDGANPSLKAITFNSAGNYTLAQGSGGSLTLNGGAGSATITDLTGTHTISAPVILATNANVDVAAAQQLILSGSISGSGGLTKQNDGVLTLAGANSYTGGTILDGGTIVLANSQALGIGSLTTVDPTIAYTNGVTIANPLILMGATTLQVDNADMAEQSGVISEAGGSQVLTKLGNGSLVLSGANTYTGGTIVSGGQLIAANPQAFGFGVFTQTGGTLQTNNIDHMIVMQNNFVQTGGTLFINLNGAPGATTNDQLSVKGTAALGGSLAINYAAGALAPGQSATYTVVTTTDGITTVSAGYTAPTLQIGALQLLINGAVSGNDFDVTLSAKQTSFANLPGTNYTPGQLSVASYFDRFAPTVTSGPTLQLLTALDAVSADPAALGSAFNQLTPLNFESFASTTAFNNATFQTQQFDNYLANHRDPNGGFVSSDGHVDYSGLAVNNPQVDPSLQSVRSRLVAWSPAPNIGLLSDSSSLVAAGIDTKDILAPGPTNLWNVFVTGNVVLAQDFSNTTAGVAGGNSTTGAVTVGADYRISHTWLVGAAFGYGHTHANLDTIGSSATVNTYSPTVYTSYASNGWYANGLASYGFTNYSQNRNVAIGAFNGTASSSPGGGQVVGDLDGGYDFHRGPWTFGPTSGLQYVHLNVNGYTESGLPGANLTVNQNETDSLRSLFGGRVNYTIKTASLIFTPHLSASWQHEFLDQGRGITSQLNGIGAGSFVVNTPNASRNSAIADVGLDTQINDALTGFVDYSVQAGQSNYFGQSVQAGFKIGF